MIVLLYHRLAHHTLAARANPLRHTALATDWL
jgi:hypothetical protein